MMTMVRRSYQESARHTIRTIKETDLMLNACEYSAVSKQLVKSGYCAGTDAGKCAYLMRHLPATLENCSELPRAIVAYVA